jgi:phenylacetate-CoA ligase
LVRDLNAFQPVMLSGYPSALQVLAKEQQAGRLHIGPVLINAAGETLTGRARQQITRAFGADISNYYGSSEAIGLTFECKHHQLHVNSDWYILEPVDAYNQPVPPGQLSHAVLVTNLPDRVQPIIRYKMGDRATIDSKPCPCGSPFPVIHVIGRTDEILTFPVSHGGTVQILPLALVTVAEETPGLASCQLIQTEPLKLLMRLSVQETEEKQQVWEELRARLGTYLAARRIANVVIEQAPEPPPLPAARSECGLRSPCFHPQAHGTCGRDRGTTDRVHWQGGCDATHRGGGGGQSRDPRGANRAVLNTRCARLNSDHCA